MGANLVAQQLDWNMTEGWGQGDAAANTYYRPLETFEQRFDAFVRLAVDAEFDTVDIWHPQLSYRWATEEHLDAARRVLTSHQVTVASYGSNFGDDLTTFRRANEIARAVGTRILGGQTPLLFSDRASVVAVLAEFGTVLGLENHPQKSAAELLAQLGSGNDRVIGATVDTGWFGTQGFDAATAIRQLGDRVVHVHLKDVRSTGTHDTCAFGDGIVPIADCVAALREIEYRGAISIEHEPEHYDPVPEVMSSRRLLIGLLEGAASREVAR
jgi:sugar phosphate isomerase/epimerase